MKLLVTSAQRLAHVCVRATAQPHALRVCNRAVATPAGHWLRAFSTNESSNDRRNKFKAAASTVDDDDDDDDDEEDVVKGPTKVSLDDDKPKKPWDLQFDDDDWDEERWGAMDSEDWQGFDGDADAMTEEGVPTWLNAVRNLRSIQDEKKMRLKLARRAYEEAKMNVVRHRQVDEQGRAYGTGRRKTSTARVWIKEAATPYAGTIMVNGKDLVDYFVRDTYREDILKPFSVVGMVGQFDVVANVTGGGLTGQSGAVRHGISRALQHFDPLHRPALKKEGLLTRDPRMVERKKPGQPKARKKFQWVKR